MDFKDTIRELAEKAGREIQKPNVNEESTKTALIMPLFQALGYNVFDTDEFCPEYNASFGKAKDARADFAILLNGAPVAMIECKSCTDKDLDKNVGQLRSYFTATVQARLGILTNGIEYRFYTDLDTNNVMDKAPFFSCSIDHITDTQLDFLYQNFRKEAFNIRELKSSAKKIRFTNRITAYLNAMISSADDRYTDFVVRESKAVSGNVTEAVKKEAKGIIRQAYQNIIINRAKQKLDGAPDQEPEEELTPSEDDLAGLDIVKKCLSSVIPADDITYRKNKHYFVIVLQHNSWKTICRLYLDGNRKKIRIHNGEADSAGRKLFIDHEITSLDDIPQYKDELVNAVRSYNV